MLKLRKNKKGFTLVELIVVIAIMAVLAGTVAGVTVSQLNKNTDKANKTKAKQVADFIAGMIADPEDFDSITQEDSTSTATPKPTIFKFSEVKTKVETQFGTDYTKTTASKGGFALAETTDHKYIHVVYNGKANGGGIDYYISLDGTISTTAPDATTTETDSETPNP